jgi:hypothetical protein
VIEVRDVAEARVKRDVENLAGPLDEMTRGRTQPRAQKVLMRRHARQPLKGTQKVKWAEAGPVCQLAEHVRGRRLVVD